jgi:hypothetical protein
MTALLIVILLGLVLVAWGYALGLRPRMRRWGATDADVAREMPGDAELSQPDYSTTLAVTVDAGSAEIWPWLMQMGYRRGGLYSYDWLDRLFGFLDGPSASHLSPFWRHLHAGDRIPMGVGAAFPVKAVDPYSSLVLGGEERGLRWSWEFGLYPLAPGRTRLVSRSRAGFADTIGRRLFMWLLEPAAFLMTRKMLLGIKQRAESLAPASDSRQRAA